MACPVTGIRSVEIEFGHPDVAAAFFVEVWHLSEVHREGGSVWFRGTGAAHHILAVHPSRGGTAVRRVVLGARDDAAVADAGARLVAAGVEPGPLQEQVGGGTGFDFTDPEGRRLAIVAGGDVHTDITDRADRPRKIAHVNFNAADLPATTAFWTDVLGFEVIDQTKMLTFLHADSSDHNAVVLCGSGRPTINHIAFELPGYEDVMRGAGRMADAGYPVEWGVGRHGPGNNVFAYFAGPEEIPLEYTSDVQKVDETYRRGGPDDWIWPPGRLDQWGATAPQTMRWKRIQHLLAFRRA